LTPDPLIVIRAVHFGATMLVAGALLFSVLVAEPVWQRSDLQPAGLLPCRKPVALVALLALVLVVASGFVQLVLIAAAVTEEPWTEVIADGAAWAFFSDTHFGAIAQLRLLLAVGLAGVLLWSAWRPDFVPNWLRVLAAAVATVFLGCLAWTGHAASATGIGANAHLLSDLVHMLAAGAWVGGLLPLVLVMREAIRASDAQSLAVCGQVVRRFSTLGLASVSALAASGVINTWCLTDHMRALFNTDYGWFVQIKIGLFLPMLCLAAVNRLRLTPAVLQVEGSSDEWRRVRALRWLQLTTALEIALGMLVIYMVGVLGMTPPAGHHHG
jgi:putative copper resistance protein D